MTQADAPDFEDLWTLARELFLSGRAGEAICRDLSIPPSTFGKRASQGGWLRRDRPAVARPPAPLDRSAPVDDLATAMDKAWRRFCIALDAGCTTEATRWGRIHARLKATAIAEGRANEADRRLMSRQQGDQIVAHTAAVARAARDELALIKAVLPPARGHGVEKVETNSRLSTKPTTDRPLNRAERRRLRRDSGP